MAWGGCITPGKQATDAHDVGDGAVVRQGYNDLYRALAIERGW